MRFMIIRRANEETEAGALPTAELVHAMMKYNYEMITAGVMLSGDGLQPTSAGALVTFQGGKPTVIDGPFAEAKELIAGYSIIEVNSREEAIEWVKRWPVEDAHGNARLEIRQLYEAEDFGEEFTPEMLAHEELLRTREAERATTGL